MASHLGAHILLSFFFDLHQDTILFIPKSIVIWIYCLVHLEPSLPDHLGRLTLEQFLNARQLLGSSKVSVARTFA